MTLTSVNRTDARPGYLLELPATTFEEPTFHPFPQLVADLQGRVISWLGHLDMSRLSITCKTAYEVWQKIFLADEGGADWVVKKIIEYSCRHFGRAMARIKRRLEAMHGQNDPRFELLFTKLLMHQARCTRGPMTERDLAILKERCPADSVEELVLAGTQYSGQQLISIVNHCKTLKKLDLSGYGPYVTDDTLHVMMSACGGTLVALHLGDVWISDATLNAVAMYCTRLATLDLSNGILITGKGIASVAKRHGGTLTTLCLDNTSISDNKLSIIAERCTQLCTLELSRCKYITGEGVTAAVRARGTTLRELNLSGIEISDNVLFAISECCAQLEILDLSKWRNISGSALAAVAKGCGKTLVELILSDSRIFDVNTGFRAIADLCSQLEKLDLSLCLSFTDEHLGAVLDRCTALRTLRLYTCVQLSGACFAAISKQSISLQGLALAGCSDVTSLNLEIMAQRCEHLVTLDLGNVNGAAGALKSIVRNCSKLERLNLNQVRGLSNEHLRFVAEHGIQLKSLALKGCTAITDEGVGPLAHGCQNLESLDLSGTSISDISLIHISKHLTKLTTLLVAQCNITDEGLNAVLLSCKHLEELDIRWTKISLAGLKSIAQHAVFLKKLGCKALSYLTEGQFTLLEGELRGVQLF